MKENTAQDVAKFLYEEIICRNGCPPEDCRRRRKRKQKRIGGFAYELSGANGHFSVSSSMQGTHRARSQSYYQFCGSTIAKSQRSVRDTFHSRSTAIGSLLGVQLVTQLSRMRQLDERVRRIDIEGLSQM